MNVGHVTMPLFQILVKDLPPDVVTTDDYTGGANPALLTPYYGKVKVLDVWVLNGTPLDLFLQNRTTTAITGAGTGYQFMFRTRMCRSLIPVPNSVKHQRTAHSCAKHKLITQERYSN